MKRTNEQTNEQVAGAVQRDWQLVRFGGGGGVTAALICRRQESLLRTIKH